MNKEGAAVPADTEAMGAASRGGKLACKKSKRTMRARSNLNKKLEKKNSYDIPKTWAESHLCAGDCYSSCRALMSHLQSQNKV